MDVETGLVLAFFEKSSAKIGIVDVFDEEIRLVYANPATMAYYGFQPGKSWSAGKGALNADTLHSYIQAYRRAKISGEAEEQEFHEVRNGREHWLAFTANYLGPAANGGDRCCFVIQEVTNRKAKELAAVSSSNMKSRFMANMSHEIRTPIHGISGIASLLRASGLTPLQNRYVDGIESSSKVLLGLVNDILDLSKIEAGKLELDLQTFQLHSFLEDLILPYEHEAQQKGLRFIFQVEPGLPKAVKGDAVRIRQILSNLLNNALKFTEKGFVRFSLLTSPRPKKNEMRYHFRIEDSGIGICGSMQKRLFEPFEQADSSTSTRFGGTGLGLSICRYLAELMQGGITVESQLGKGSAFEFWVDLKQSKNYVMFEEERILPPMHGRVLIAEDNPVNQMIARSMCESIGLDSDVVSHGQEALRALEEKDFDLVLMDCQMPQLDGYETTRKIRKNRRIHNPNLPIIALTASVMKGDLERCLDAGMNDYLAKPVTSQSLKKMLCKWLLPEPKRD